MFKQFAVALSFLLLTSSAAVAQDPVQPPVVDIAQNVNPPFEITAQDNPAPAAVIEKALADQAKAGYPNVDYSKVDYSPDAPAFEGLYAIDPNTWIQAECGGKYVDEECWLRPGVPVPPNVVFTAVDENGNYTFKGIHPPTEAEMRALIKPAQ